MKIHMLGIGGTGMASLAGLLVSAGHAVTGSDGPLYPPMSEQIAELGITPFVGYDAAHIDAADPELVIIGNVIRRDNPEAQAAMAHGLPVQSMPGAIEELFLAERTPIVVAGTHGKTTLTALIAWLLESARQNPGFLVGGIPKNVGRSFALGAPPYFVIEGDEYDSAFFDKGPKFLHYHPQALVLTAIEFDHADIYADVETIVASFRRLIGAMSSEGLIVANGDDERVRALVREAPCPVVTYGLGRTVDVRPEGIAPSPEGTRFTLADCGGEFLLPMWGEYNVLNATAALALLSRTGIAAEALRAGLAAFAGVRRRQETILDERRVALIDDFAHHPTAVGKTIAAMRERFPHRRLWAIFEPRSNTSRRNVFQQEFTRALANADRVIIADVYRAQGIPAAERLDVERMAEALTRGGVEAHHISRTEHIVEFVLRGVAADDVILVMSNGAFDGLVGRLAAGIDKRRIVEDEAAVKPARVPR